MKPPLAYARGTVPVFVQVAKNIKVSTISKIQTLKIGNKLS
jgi:hypothetical protein